MRLAMKPGTSLEVDVVLPMALASACVTNQVSSDVYKPRITSTSFITGTGFMKCMPMTW